MSKPTQEKNIQIPDQLLRQLLTPSELRMIKNRFFVYQLLEEGLSIRKVAERAKVGTDTVVRVARLVEKVGIRKKGSKLNNRPPKIRTSWIFGKSND